MLIYIEFKKIKQKMREKEKNAKNLTQNIKNLLSS